MRGLLERAGVAEQLRLGERSPEDLEPDDPPGLRVVSYALRMTPNAEPTKRDAYSPMLVLAMMIAPAACSRCTMVASRFDMEPLKLEGLAWHFRGGSYFRSSGERCTDRPCIAL